MSPRSISACRIMGFRIMEKERTQGHEMQLTLAETPVHCSGLQNAICIGDLEGKGLEISYELQFLVAFEQLLTLFAFHARYIPAHQSDSVSTNCFCRT